MQKNIIIIAYILESNKQMGKIKEMPIFEELSYFYVQKLHAANAVSY